MKCDGEDCDGGWWWRMVMGDSVGRSNNQHVHGAPWSAAIRLNAHRTGSFSWRLSSRLSTEDLTLPRAAHLEDGVIGCHRVFSLHCGSAPASTDMLPTPSIYRHATNPQHLQTCDHPPASAGMRPSPIIYRHVTNPQHLQACDQPPASTGMRPAPSIYKHVINPPSLSRILAIQQVHPTHHSHDYHTHTPTVTNPTAFHAQLWRFWGSFSGASEGHSLASVLTQQQQQQPDFNDVACKVCLARSQDIFRTVFNNKHLYRRFVLGSTTEQFEPFLIVTELLALLKVKRDLAGTLQPGLLT